MCYFSISDKNQEEIINTLACKKETTIPPVIYIFHYGIEKIITSSESKILIVKFRRKHKTNLT